MVTFLYETLRASEGYRPELLSLAISSQDEASVRVAGPTTWSRGPRITRRVTRGIEHRHLGAWFCELEPFRYQPREPASSVLSEFDLVQFVVGSPPWAHVAKNVDVPVFLWTATTVRQDRATRLAADSGPRVWWRRAMSRWAEAYEERALRGVDRIFALSDYTRRTLLDHFSMEAKLATQGIDTDTFHPIEKPEEGHILTVSRINDPRKRIPFLLRAYARAKEKVATSIPELYLVGEDPNEHIRSRAEQLGLKEDVRFLGRKSQSELVELYQNALCFVLSSEEEGLGIVILEAMACGRPVVSTKCGGPETLVLDDETGFLTPVEEKEALARGMVRLVENPERRSEMGKNARRRVEQHFSIEAAKEPFFDVYEAY